MNKQPVLSFPLYDFNDLSVLISTLLCIAVANLLYDLNMREILNHMSGQSYVCESEDRNSFRTVVVTVVKARILFVSLRHDENRHMQCG